MTKNEVEEICNRIEEHARKIEMLAGNPFHYGQFIGLLRSINIIQKGFHEDFSNPGLSSEARKADRASYLGRQSDM